MVFMPKLKVLGKNERMSFSKIDEILEMPNLIAIQKDSYNWFLEKGLKEVFEDVSSVVDYSGNIVLDLSTIKWMRDRNIRLSSARNAMRPTLRL